MNISSLIVSNDAFSINTIVPGQVNCSSLVVGDVDIDTKKDNAISNASNAVYFKARGGTNITINNGDILQYNTIIFNEGGGYNNSTYKFTAPVTGLYHFIISFISSSSFATEVDIYQYDGVERIIERIKGSGIKKYFGSVITFCNAADQIYSKCTLNKLLINDGGTGDQLSNFSGFLIT